MVIKNELVFNTYCTHMSQLKWNTYPDIHEQTIAYKSLRIYSGISNYCSVSKLFAYTNMVIYCGDQYIPGSGMFMKCKEKISNYTVHVELHDAVKLTQYIRYWGKIDSIFYTNNKYSLGCYPNYFRYSHYDLQLCMVLLWVFHAGVTVCHMYTHHVDVTVAWVTRLCNVLY